VIRQNSFDNEIHCDGLLGGIGPLGWAMRVSRFGALAQPDLKFQIEGLEMAKRRSS
jgi:hypothetical protein